MSRKEVPSSYDHSLQHTDRFCSPNSVEKLQSGQSLPVIHRCTIQLRCKCILQYLYSAYNKFDDHFDVRTDVQPLRMLGPHTDLLQVYSERSGRCHCVHRCHDDIYHHHHHTFDRDGHRGNEYCQWRNHHVTAHTITITHFTTVTAATITQSQASTLTNTITVTVFTTATSTVPNAMQPRAVSTPSILPTLVEKRADTSQPGWVTYPPARLSSACSCILDAASPPATILSTLIVSITATSTSNTVQTDSVVATESAVATIYVTAIETIMKTDLATATESITATELAAATETVTETSSVVVMETTTIPVTVTTTQLACPTPSGNLIQNGNWESGTNDPWDVFREGSTIREVSHEAAETCEFGFKASVNPGIWSYMQMSQRIVHVAGRSYTLHGSYKFLEYTEDCILRVGGFDLPELTLPNTPAIAGAWQQFTVTFSISRAWSQWSDTWILYSCRAVDRTEIIYLDNWSLVEN